MSSIEIKHYPNKFNFQEIQIFAGRINVHHIAI